MPKTDTQNPAPDVDATGSGAYPNGQAQPQVDVDGEDRLVVRPRRGRPRGSGTRLDEGLIDRICTAVAAGNYLKTAAALQGVSEGTVQRWSQLGADPESAEIFQVFRRELTKARAMAEARAVQHITRAASDGQWTAAAWFLERTNAQEWGRKERLEVTGADGGPLEVASADDARMVELAARLAARQLEKNRADDDGE